MTNTKTHEAQSERNVVLNHTYAAIERSIEMGQVNYWGLSDLPQFSQGAAKQKEDVLDYATNRLTNELGVSAVPFVAELTNPNAVFMIGTPEPNEAVQNGEPTLKKVDLPSLSSMRGQVGGIIITRYQGSGDKPVGPLSIFEADHPESLVRRVAHTAGIPLPPEVEDVQKQQLFVFGLVMIDPTVVAEDGSEQTLSGVYFIEHDWDQDLTPIPE